MKMTKKLTQEEERLRVALGELEESIKLMIPRLKSHHAPDLSDILEALKIGYKTGCWEGYCISNGFHEEAKRMREIYEGLIKNLS